ncbi:hypothetical protein O6H91_07G000500 [Diphasiastrum complanatum]|uniref:Uncharacterized protein n=1 Tax=Diphasiastrum complanatum TaxID=34168 RepID=A0ACC2D1Q6_DIPCM|nr:hypothetical protein O6H91_07G000500 [Diphasiastrum complanatum]
MTEPMECSVCISEFQENETGRLLPKCNHCFHTACIDTWFNSHSTCPLCRGNVGDQKPISHEDAENMPLDEEMGLQEAPSHDVMVEPSFVLNYRNLTEEQIGSNSENLSKNPFGLQGTSSEQQQQQEDTHSNLHMKPEKLNPSKHFPVNTLFYENQNEVSSRSSSRAEQVKKSEHLVIEVPNRLAICPSDCSP